MADERTEQATPKRREDARKRGEVARSADLPAAAALLGALLGLRLAWRPLLTNASDTLLWCFRAAPAWRPSIPSTIDVAAVALRQSAWMVLPLLAGASIAALAANLGQSGFLISAHPLMPKWSRLSLVQGFTRMFSRQGLFSLLRSLAKLALVLLVSFLYLRGRAGDVLDLSAGTPFAAGGGLAALIFGLLIRVALVLAIIAVADYLYQRHEHEKRLRMTRHEQREEHKQTEGDPLVRSRMREQQRALARHRMMEAVKNATVVVTNPLEFAVAVRYEPRRTPAPIVVAKGRRLLADRIRAEARKHGVPVTPSPDLARALYRSVPVGRQIPPDLYQAVAEILAFVYRTTGRAPRGV